MSLPMAAAGPLKVPTNPILTPSAVAAPRVSGVMQPKLPAPAASQVRALRMSPPVVAPLLDVLAPSPRTMGEPIMPVNKRLPRRYTGQAGVRAVSGGQPVSSRFAPNAALLALKSMGIQSIIFTDHLSVIC